MTRVESIDFINKIRGEFKSGDAETKKNITDMIDCLFWELVSKVPNVNSCNSYGGTRCRACDFTERCDGLCRFYEQV